MSDALQIALGALEGLLSSSVFVLALFIGFCMLFGLTKLVKTAGNGAVVKSLDETITHKSMVYLTPGAPRGPADQLRSPELLEAAAARK
ncbi:MAG: hypothetical protein GEU82_00350 [Luteitalea sp.]|nr:hypothetical protein [Luteitalea sp.]